MKRSHLQIAVYMLAVFLSGMLVGALAYRLYTVKAVAAAPPRNPEEFRKRYVDDMRQRLQLDDGQATRLNEILDHTNERFKAFREQHKTETDAIHQEQVTEIRAMLSDSQQANYEELRKERERMRRQADKKR